MKLARILRPLCLFYLALFGFISPSLAGDLDESLPGLVDSSRATIKMSIKEVATIGGEKALEALQALKAQSLRRDEAGNILMILDEEETRAKNLVSGETIEIGELELERPIINNSVRRVLSLALAQLHLSSDDAEVRMQAAVELNKRPNPTIIALVKSALAKETEAEIKSLFILVLAQAQLESDETSERITAITTIAESGNLTLKPKLEEILEKDEDGNYYEEDKEVIAAASSALSSFESKQWFISQVGNLFYGLSLGSVLLLAALGLAITFGLMGVINMAHGEMLMLGAYCAYFMQNIFDRFAPDYIDFYLLAAIPFALAVTTFIGIVLEQTIIRFLYGRPLETLLATWGISLILIQTVRLIFGAQNVEVANPAWLSDGVEVAHGIVLPYNRIAIIFFAIFVVALVWWLMKKTPFGLQVRAVTQNRSMASCLGISTSKVDMWTFGLGSGVAGLGGVALSQIGNVGPELGQAYIVDSFMVVVLGGVGEITGTVAGAFGLGIVNKFLEPVSGAVLGKIIVLIFVVLFIQKRPQGLFALKGRVGEN